MAEWFKKLSKVATIVALLFGFALPGAANEVAAGQSLFSNLLWLVAGLLVSASIATSSSSIRLVEIWNSRHVRWVLVLLLGSFAWTMLSSLLMGGQANFRHAINAMWQWCISGIIMLVVLFQSPSSSFESRRWTRQLLLLILSAGWCLALHGLHQKLIEIPNDIRRYEADPVAVLREAGLQAEKDSGVDLMYRGRLFDAAPTATYSLTNSFAILLAACLVLSSSILSFNVRRSWMLIGIILVFVMIPLALCLLWTKSRTAWLAAFVCLGFIVMTNATVAQTLKIHRRKSFVVGSLVLVAAIVGLLVWDRSIFSNALASLLYRSSYWWTTLEMVKDYPILGIGAGNFQDYYSEYKPVLSAETVSDPHSLWFETLASGGPIALVLLVAAALMLLFRIMQMKRGLMSSENLVEPGEEHANATPSSAKVSIDWSLLSGVFLGVIIPWAAAIYTGVIPDPTTYVFTVPIAGVLVYALVQRFDDCLQFTSSAVFATLANVTICLTFAGGWMTPGISNWYFVLMGMSLCSLLEQTDQEQSVAPNRLTKLLPLVAVALMIGLFAWSAWFPVRSAAVDLVALEEMRQAPSTQQLRELIANDAWDPALWRQAAAVEQAKCVGLLSRGQIKLAADGELASVFQEFSQNMIDRNKQSWQAWTQRGHWRLELAMYDDSWLPLAVEDYDKAVELYPGDVDVLIQAALASMLHGELHKSSELLSRAERIDQETVHFERKIYTGVVYWPASFDVWLRRKKNSDSGLDRELARDCEATWKTGRELSGTDPSRLKAEPLARVMRRVLDNNLRAGEVSTSQ